MRLDRNVVYLVNKNELSEENLKEVYNSIKLDVDWNIMSFETFKTNIKTLKYIHYNLDYGWCFSIKYDGFDKVVNIKDLLTSTIINGKNLANTYKNTLLNMSGNKIIDGEEYIYMGNDRWYNKKQLIEQLDKCINKK